MEGERQVPASEQVLPGWRYKAGLGMFIFGNIVFFASPLVTVLGLNAVHIGTAVILAEITIWTSVFFLGWRGLKQLKNKMFGFLKYDPEAPPVSRFRHDLGIFLTFILSFALEILAFVLMIVAYARATPADPFPLVWGLNYAQLGWAVGGLFMGGYVSLVVGLLVLGDHWWGRFRELFMWQGQT